MKLYNVKMNVEKSWQHANEMKFFNIESKRLNNIVDAMEELAFVYGEEDEYYTLTDRAMDCDHVKYLNSIGFNFKNYVVGDTELVKTDNLTLDTFGISRDAFDLANNMNLKYKAPTIDSVSAVNSKVYSTELAHHLGYAKESVIISDYEGFREESYRLLQSHKKIIIKEEYGVSGKGNHLVDDEKKLRRFEKEVEKQESKGKKISLIIEPFYDVDIDFSTQFYISQEGEYRLLSTQMLLNNEFAYGGAISIDEGFKQILIEQTYYELMERVGRELFKSGYFGHVCVDSMILKNGKLVPIVEINARRSMSLMKYCLDKRFCNENKKSIFFSLDIETGKESNFKSLLERIKDRGLLYSRLSKQGIIPLSSNTIFINSYLYDEERSRGRIYCYGISNDNPVDLIYKTKELLA